MPGTSLVDRQAVRPHSKRQEKLLVVLEHEALHVRLDRQHSRIVGLTALTASAVLSVFLFRTDGVLFFLSSGAAAAGVVVLGVYLVRARATKRDLTESLKRTIELRHG